MDLSVSQPTQKINNLGSSNAVNPSSTTTDGDNHVHFSSTPMKISDLFNNEKNNESLPLIEKLPPNSKPPLAGPETDDDDIDDRQVSTKPYPGVDDGFFGNGTGDNPDVEKVPTHPEFEGDDDDEIPTLGPRAGEPDESDGRTTPRPGSLPDGPPKPFPYPPGFGPDIEAGSVPFGGSIPDINVYQNKKTLAQGMMDLALLSANANQLRYVLESYDRHPYFYPSLAMISISLILQVAVGVGLIWNARYNVKDEKEICIANKINNFTIIGIFLVTVINVFISAFGVANAPATPATVTTP